MTLNNVTTMMKHDNEIGTSNRPPKFFGNNDDFVNWKARFESFVVFNDSDMWVPIVERYFRPAVSGPDGEGDDPQLKKIRQMTETERRDFDNDRKAHAAITMCLSTEVFLCFKHITNAYDLWRALQLRFGGSDLTRKSKKDLLKRQFDLFSHLPNKSLDGLISRFPILTCELKELGVNYRKSEIKEKLRFKILACTMESRVILVVVLLFTRVKTCRMTWLILVVDDRLATRVVFLPHPPLPVSPTRVVKLNPQFPSQLRNT